eukprot:gene31628-39068_t
MPRNEGKPRAKAEKASRSTEKAGRTVARSAPRSSKAAPPAKAKQAPAPDSDVALLAALVAHTQASRPSRQPETLSAKLKQCRQLSTRGAEQCRVRTCASAKDDPLLPMTLAAVAQVAAGLAQFSSATRLYALRLPEDAAVPDAGELFVEAFVADEQLQETGARDIIVLSTSAFVDLRRLLGKAAALEISLADGSRTAFGGEVTQAAMLGSEGGMARYRLRLTPWLWRLSQARNSRVWQDKPVLDIVGSVFDSYGGARWRVSDDVAPFMEGVAPRSYCCQYRETDLDFVRRLLAEEGLGWRFEDGEEGQSLVIHADTLQRSAIPEDSSSAAGDGVRFHGVRPGEQQDTVQALQARRYFL